MIDRIEHLKQTPNMGVLANDKLSQPLSTEYAYRLLFLDPYVAVYLFEEENQLVKIIRVLHHKQDYPALF